MCKLSLMMCDFDVLNMKVLKYCCTGVRSKNSQVQVYIMCKLLGKHYLRFNDMSG
jgi:hypothetical protein